MYAELRRLAAAQLAREKPGQTLNATALVHEAYVRLVGPADEERWQSRGHFFAAAAEAMRHILVDIARRKGRKKREGERVRMSLDAVDPAAAAADEDLLALDEALTRLAGADPTAAELVKLRYFAGLTIPQAAEALDIGRGLPTAFGRMPRLAARCAFWQLGKNGPRILARFPRRWRISK